MKGKNKMNDINWKDVKVAHEAIKHLPGCLYWKDERGFYQGCNLNVAILAGKSQPQELFGKRDADLSWGSRAEEIRAADMYVMQNDKEISFREEMPTISGGKIVYQTRKRALKVDDKIVGVVGYSIDVTEQEIKEQRDSEFQNNISELLQTTEKILDAGKTLGNFKEDQ